MKRSREIIGLPVVALDSGRTIGRIEDVVYSIEERSLKGFILTKAGWLKEKEIILHGDVVGIGKDAMTVASESCKRTLHSASSLDSVLTEPKFNKQRLITSNGEYLGVVQDVVFEEQEGVIAAIEISEGLLNDIVEGRTLISFPQQITLEKTNCVISEGEQGE